LPLSFLLRSCYSVFAALLPVNGWFFDNPKPYQIAGYISLKMREKFYTLSTMAG